MRRPKFRLNVKFTSVAKVVLMLALAASHASGQMCVPPPHGLVSWWTGDGTTLDYFGRNDGSPLSRIAYGTGEVADTFSFNGSEYVGVLRSPSLEPSNITVDAWVNAAVKPGPFAYVVSKGGLDDTAGSYAIYTGPSAGLQFYIFDGLTVAASPDAGAGVWDGNWHHVAGIFDGAAVHLFLDGSEVGSGTATTTAIAYGLTAASNVTNDLFIGDYNPNCIGCSPHAFVGEIDELEIFKRALAPAAISGIFAAGRAGQCLPVRVSIESRFRDEWGQEADWHSDEDSLGIAILGSAAFNAADIIQSTLLLSRPGDRRHPMAVDSCYLKEVNGDNFPDLICRFRFDKHRLHDDEDDPALIITGQVLIPGGQRTFFGKHTIELEPERDRHR